MSRTATICTLLLAAAAVPPAAARQHPEPPAGPVEGVDFRVYDARGRDRSFADLLSSLDRTDVVLVGEIHDDVVGHAVESEIFLRAAQRLGALAGGADARPVVLSLEMFERDVQLVVDEYLDGLITEEQFKRASRPWDRYDTDYRPMVELARAHGLEVVAANAPRRYVNRVTRLGAASLGTLPDAAKAYLPPLPYPGPSERYTAQWNELMAGMAAHAAPSDSAGEAMPRPSDPVTEQPSAPRHDMGFALQSQALWDAAMAHAVTEALRRSPRGLVVHYAGSFHVQRHTGIPEKVLVYRPGTRVVTVVLQPVADVAAFDDEEHRDLADFVILTSRPEAEAAADGPGFSLR